MIHSVSAFKTRVNGKEVDAVEFTTDTFYLLNDEVNVNIEVQGALFSGTYIVRQISRSGYEIRCVAYEREGYEQALRL